MSRENKSKFSLSFSKDVSEFINKYAKEKGISLSVAAERILIKGIEVIESNNYNKLAEEISKLIGNNIQLNNPIVKDEEQEEIQEKNEGNFDVNNENDMAMLDIFNSIPD